MTLDALFSAPAEEAAYPVEAAVGRLPDWLAGGYYVNGPGGFQTGDVAYRHWLDGDGMVVGLRFDRGRTRFCSRFVDSRKRCQERRAGRALYRTFGTGFPGDRLRRNVMLEPPVNVAVQPFAGALLALGEQSLPLELDPDTLETRSEYDFHGALNEVSPFAAHAKIEASSGRLVNFGVSYGSARTTLTLYEFDSDGRKISRRREALEAPYTIHDFALSERYAVFHVGRYLLRAERLLAGGTLFDALEYDAERPCELLLAPRAKAEPVRRIKVDGGYCLHLINAFEQDGVLTVDLILYERPLYPEYQPLPRLFETVSRGRPMRYRLSADASEAQGEPLIGYDAAPDFPSLDPRRLGRPYGAFFCLGMSACGRPGSKFFDQLVRLSWDGDEPAVYTLPAGEFFGGEPAVAPGPEPDEDAVIVQRFAGQPRIALFRAVDIAAGPIAEIPLSTRILPGFHAVFQPREADA